MIRILERASRANSQFRWQNMQDRQRFIKCLPFDRGGRIVRHVLTCMSQHMGIELGFVGQSLHRRTRGNLPIVTN
jgi:hypothetical protein